MSENKYPEDIQAKIEVAAQWYENPDIFKAGVDYAFTCAKVIAQKETQPGQPPLPEPILTDEDVKACEDIAAGREEDAVAIVEELWDEHAEYIDDDIDSLSRWAGSTVVDKEQFKTIVAKMWELLKQQKDKR